MSFWQNVNFIKISLSITIYNFTFFYLSVHFIPFTKYRCTAKLVENQGTTMFVNLDVCLVHYQESQIYIWVSLYNYCQNHIENTYMYYHRQGNFPCILSLVLYNNLMLTTWHGQLYLSMSVSNSSCLCNSSSFNAPSLSCLFPRLFRKKYE